MFPTMRTFVVLSIITQLAAVVAFSPSLPTRTALASSSSTTTSALRMVDQDDENFMKWARAARYASDEDTVVELPRPLGLVLNQDPNGNVYVETVAPKGNAARTGKVCVCVCV